MDAGGAVARAQAAGTSRGTRGGPCPGRRATRHEGGPVRRVPRTPSSGADRPPLNGRRRREPRPLRGCGRAGAVAAAISRRGRPRRQRRGR
ncbi:hypothetical protein FTX61_10820 [Nitriliruptoraceae bacterium ZYF776]|nr:hypothetical protein [Profundirhabdus halotolerans]